MQKRKRTKGIARAAVSVVGVGLAALILAGCGGYYYRATIQGFVIDEETDAGINEATVRIYTDEVDSADAEGFVAQTSTVTQGGSAGYYSSTVIWRRVFGAYGREGDTTTIWIAVTHPDYGSAVVAAKGILSGDDNLVAPIRLDQTTFSIPALRGRVEDQNGAGLNGVRVVLEIPVLSGDESPDERVTQTATIDGTPGRFEFAPVSWSDRNTADPGGEVAAVVRVDDPEWGAEDGESPVQREVVLVPAEQTRHIATPFPVYRLPRTEFSTVVEGRLLERTEDFGGQVDDRGVQGVRVKLEYWRRTDEQPDPHTDSDDPFRVLIDHTDAQGTYRFNVSWTDLAPGDFDHADVRSQAAISDEPGATDGIAPGEDGLIVRITYADAEVPDGTLEFSERSGFFDIYSNPRGGVNRLPDVIRSAQ